MPLHPSAGISPLFPAIDSSMSIQEQVTSLRRSMLNSQVQLNGSQGASVITVTAATGLPNARTLAGTGNRISLTDNGSGGTLQIDIAASYVGQTSITTVGTVATGTWSATAIGATHGGTGQTTVTQGDLLQGSSGNTWIRLGGNTTTTNKFLTMASSTAAWATIAVADIPTLTHTKISDFDTQVRTSRLDQMASPGADVPFGGFKITGLADPASAQDAATRNYTDTHLQLLSPVSSLDTGAANAYVATLSPAPSSYATFLHLYVKIVNANTGASTLNVNGLGAKAIKTQAGADPAAGAIAAGGIYHFVYDGANFQIV